MRMTENQIKAVALKNLTLVLVAAVGAASSPRAQEIEHAPTAAQC